jgi:hypothetical protein
MGSQRPGEHSGMQYYLRGQELTVSATITWIIFPSVGFDRRRNFAISKSPFTKKFFVQDWTGRKN